MSTAALGALILAALLALHTTEGTGGRASSSPASARDGHRALRSRSPLGMPLGEPPLALKLDASPALAGFSLRHPPRAGLLFDMNSGQILWQRAPTRVLPIASLAKMMTALIVARSLPLKGRVLITRRAVNAVGSKVGLLPEGRHLSVRTLLYGLLLPSGNDAAIALAEAAAGSVSRFVRKMNVQAARLGLGCTRLSSPDGLDERNRSCAVDLAELAYADLAQRELAPIVSSASAVLPFPIRGGRLYLYSNNPLLRYGYPGATGLKTGETNAAGLCLVGTAQRSGVRLGVVLLHSPELGRQAASLLNLAFQRVYHQRPIPAQAIPKGR
jgi:serine-type D-Ala-D-Ala carboxypeptidase (penicillin-binding protein 5/6)